jgi:DNA-binding NarL/FixJ family response regulator
MGDPSALRVLVVARDWCWREAVLRVLERGDDLSGGFDPHPAAGADALARLGRGEIDVALVDLGDPDGAFALATLRDAGVACIAVGEGHGESEVAAALNAEASYALKSELDPGRLRQLVRVAASGDALFVRASRRTLERLAGEPAATRFNLTPRELDVLRHLAAGRTNAEIAAELHLAPSSVKKLVSRCLARLGVRNRVEAALLARREGIVGAATRLH